MSEKPLRGLHPEMVIKDMTNAEINEAVRKVWKTKSLGIKTVVSQAKECCGVGCERCVWELSWIIQELLKLK